MLNQFKSSLNNALKTIPDWKNLRTDWADGRFPLEAFGARGSWTAVLLSKLADVTGGAILVIASDETEARSLASDLSLFTDDVSFFPWWGTMLYRGVSPQASVFGKRATVLSELASKERRIIVTSLRAALGLLPPPSEISGALIRLKKGGKIDPVEIEDSLQKYGYTRVSRVSVPGEFALRGEVLDVAPVGEENAVRIVFAWDEVEEIRLFDPLTQASVGSVEHVILHPLRELIWDNQKLERLKSVLHGEEYIEVFEALETGRDWRGEELFYPLAFQNPATLQDYLPDRSVTVFLDIERLELAESNMLKEYEKLHSDAVMDGLAVPAPETLVSGLKDFVDSKERRLIFHAVKKDDDTGGYNVGCEPGRSFFGNIAYLKEEFTSLNESGYEIFVFAPRVNRRRRE